MKITVHFDDREFECHDGTPVPGEYVDNMIALAQMLEKIRWAAGCAISVVSGWRSRAWNDRVGGAKDSQHLKAKAADIRGSALIQPPELHHIIMQMHAAGKLPELGGIGEYRSWVHVDTAKSADGHLRRWKGGGVGSEQ